ncbi:TetR/AcrR family transcriptional regulator [Nocardiopsis sp. CNT312]|uniref:TetR/AcrR family transcriptional regulator n=1 Tax=Nocardiopsis sp. CNT312 TaxID=1137268 RepID=UPI00048CE6A8|nr:TetR/AcrR family transcriptional regulator [Nocardiopsis sp. CNT312]
MADRPYHHGDLRAALLAGAERALEKRGPEALSLRELAREAGVSHAAPGRHFKDKQTLLDALALTGFERLNGYLEPAVAGAETARERLFLLARAYVGFAVEHAALLDLMYARKHSPNAPEELTEAVERILETVVRPIAEGQAAGEVVDGDPAALATAVSATVHGLAMFTADSSPTAPDAQLREVLDVLYNGLGPR